MNYLQQILTTIFGSVPSIILAIVLLVVAWLVATVISRIVVKLCNKFDIGGKLFKHGEGRDEKAANDLVETIGKIIFVVVFILFVPGILDNLQLQGVSQPITNMMNTLFGYLPNIVGAVAIVVIGMFFAKIVKQIVVSILKGLKFDKLQEKVGIKSDNATVGFSSLIGSVVYFLILIPIIIAALQVLRIDSITIPAVAMLNSIFGMVPNVFIAIILIVVGVFIGKLVESLLAALLSGLGINKLMDNFIKDNETRPNKILLSNIIGKFVKYIIIVLLAVQSLNVLHLDVLNNLGAMVVNYLPSLIGAVIVFGVGFLLASFVENIMKKYAARSAFAAAAVKWAIIALTVFMTLNQLQVASLIVNTTFIVIVGAAAVACAIAFGVGGKNAAADLLKKLSGALEKKEEEMKDGK